MLIGNITVRENCRWTDQAILHSKISSPLAVNSPAQSLNCHANSYHIHLNTLGFHGCGKEISQICPYPFCPINTSFSGTPSPSCHSTTPYPLSWRRHRLRTLRTSTRISSNNPQSLRFLLPQEEMAINFIVPEVSSSSLSFCCTPVHLQLFY